MKKGFLFTLLLVIGLSACAPAGGSFRLTAEARGGFAPAATDVPTAVPLPTATITPVPATETPVPAPTFTPTLVMFPVVTFAQPGICRTGPATRYYRTGLVIAKGKTFAANARSADGTWLSVQAPSVGDYCWLQPAVLTDPSVVSSLRVVDVQPLPDSPINLVSGSPACGNRKHLLLSWYAVYGMGYHVYRNGKQIATVYDGEFVDRDTPQVSTSTDFLYAVEAFNASGVSLPNTISVTIC